MYKFFFHSYEKPRHVMFYFLFLLITFVEKECYLIFLKDSVAGPPPLAWHSVKTPLDLTVLFATRRYQKKLNDCFEKTYNRCDNYIMVTIQYKQSFKYII